MDFLQTIFNVFKNAKSKKYYRPRLIVLLLFVLFITFLPWFASSEAKQLIASSLLMKTMDRYAEVIFFCIAAMLVFQALCFILMLALRHLVVLLSGIFEVFWEDITMSSFGMFLVFLIVSNLSSVSWVNGFYEFVISSPSVIQYIIEITLGLDLIFSVYVGATWLIERYRDDHKSFYDVPSGGHITYEQYKSQKERVSNR